MGTINISTKSIAIVFFVVFMIACTVYAKVIGTNGATYMINEPDAYEELMAKVAKADWNRVIEKYKTDTEKLTKVSINLSGAKQDRKFVIDPTYTLNFDIMDDKGNVIYPKGFSFNPLDYIQFPYRIVFFNARSDVEINWIKSQQWFSDWNTMLIATNGDILETEEKLGKSVYVADEQMIKKLRITKTPSIVTTKDKQIVVEEVGVYK